MLPVTPYVIQRVRLLALSALVPFAVSLTTACRDSTSVNSETLAIQAGNNQTDTVTGTLPIPLQVLVTNSAGVGVPGVTVDWVASGGNPSVARVVTDGNGFAQFSWTLEATAGEQTMTATISGQSVVFVAIANAGAPTELVPVGGDAQSATHGTLLPSPLALEVIDQYGNPVPGTTVMWAVTLGGGILGNGTVSGTTVTTTTGDDGEAQATWTLGAHAGGNTATATVGALPPYTFGATGL